MLRNLSSSSVLRLNENTNVFHQEYIVAAAAAKSLSRVRLCATPETAAHQVPLCLGFSRQVHYGGLPLPSPTHKSEK